VVAPSLPLASGTDLRSVRKMNGPDQTDDLSEHSLEPREYSAVELSSNGLAGSVLIPTHLRPPEPVPWLCDGRTIAVYGRMAVLDARSCSALWCGYDPDQFMDPSEASRRLTAWRAAPERWEAMGMATFLRCLDAIAAALGTGSFVSSMNVVEPAELSLVTAESFFCWAKRVNLERPRDLSKRPWSWGVYTTPGLEAVRQVVSQFHRLVIDGGSYDPTDPRTHPEREVMLAALAQIWNGSPSLNLISKMTQPTE